MTTLVLTNDFPPRIGGIERFVAQLCDLLDGDVVVLTSAHRGAAEHDATLTYPVHRLAYPLLPTPWVARLAIRLLREHGATRVLFGAAAPLGLLAPRLRRAGADRIVALTHGHETWWARVPVAKTALRRIGGACDTLTTIADYTERQIAPALRPEDRGRLVRLAPPVDVADYDASDYRSRPPVVIAPGRLVARKGVDVLLEAWPAVTAAVPEAELHVVGDGPLLRRLRADAQGLTGVRFLGGVPHAAMPGLFAQARVCALPVHARWWGLDAEGLGIVFLEAAASGLPVLVGKSGGAPETVEESTTGYVLGTRPADWSACIVQLLTEPGRAEAMGAAGRARVADRFAVAPAAAILRSSLGLAAG